MSIDEQQTQTGNSPGDPRGSGSGRRTAVIVGVLITVLAVTGVGAVVLTKDDQPGGIVLTEPSTAPTAPSVDPVTSPPAELTVEEQILTQYREFSIVLDTLADLPASERPAVLREVAADPQYTSSLEDLAAFDAAGETFYGTTQINPKVSNVGVATAVVQDCQDGSQSGRMRKSDGVKLTVGLPAELAVTQMRRGPDGIWRVAEVVYPPNRTC